MRGANIFGAAIFGIMSIIFFIAMAVLYIYMFVLLVKLANRGIKALDIYINKNSSPYNFGQHANQMSQQYNPPVNTQLNRDENKNEG